jgi:hypothetical protein
VNGNDIVIESEDIGEIERIVGALSTAIRRHRHTIN